MIRSINETEDEMITYLNPEPKILNNKTLSQFPFMISELSKNNSNNHMRQGPSCKSNELFIVESKEYTAEVKTSSNF